MKLKMLLITIGMIMAGLTIYSNGKMVNAAGINERPVTSSHVMSQEIPGFNAAESSGVTELDNARTRVDKLIEWVCKWIGAIIALVALIAAIIMASSHQTEQRNQALVVMVFGVIIFFAPQIINYILNR